MCWRPEWDLHPRVGVLQTPALLLGYQAAYCILDGIKCFLKNQFS